MSVNFEKPMNEDAQNQLQNLFGEHVAQDSHTTLFNKMAELDRKIMSELAKTAGQPVVVELNSLGDTKEVDGIKYILTSEGWQKDEGVS